MLISGRARLLPRRLYEWQRCSSNSSIVVRVAAAESPSPSSRVVGESQAFGAVAGCCTPAGQQAKRRLPQIRNLGPTRTAFYTVKSSQVVGLRDRVAIIRTLIFSSPRPYAGSGSEWGRPLGGTSAWRPVTVTGPSVLESSHTTSILRTRVLPRIPYVRFSHHGQ